MSVAGPDILQAPSPNFGDRRDGARPEIIILHYTAMKSAEAALERLCDPKAEVSAHYLIAEDARIWQMVADDKRAWHAGVGCWQGKDDLNSRSIGIELANRGDHPFSNPQMRALENLMQALMTRWSILPIGVIAHSDMAPGRKGDPGPRFDWCRLAQQGLAFWPTVGAPLTCDLDRFRMDLSAFGYPDVADDLLLEAMRMRFRPWGRGALSPEDMAVAAALARHFVDPGDATA